jgi:hypothetical protein
VQVFEEDVDPAMLCVSGRHPRPRDHGAHRKRERDPRRAPVRRAASDRRRTPLGVSGERTWRACPRTACRASRTSPGRRPGAGRPAAGRWSR